MIIYSTRNPKLSPLKEFPFKLERDLQKVFEQNLSEITNLEFIKSEFIIKNSRIDTLAFDSENNAFVIIEYKRDRNYSVVDQGVSYLNLMLEYKADFIIEYNESKQKNLKRDQIDWSQSKVMFVSSAFTDFQKQSTNFKDLSIELWEVKRFEGDIIVISPIKKSASAPSIKPIAEQNKQLEKVTKEIKTFIEEDHIARAPEEIGELYNAFKTSILNLSPDIDIQAKKDYIAFKKGTNIVDITLLKRSLKMWINVKKGTLDDPKNLMRDVSEIGHWGNGDYEVIVDNDSNLEYIMSLIKQALIK